MPNQVADLTLNLFMQVNNQTFLKLIRENKFKSTQEVLQFTADSAVSQLFGDLPQKEIEVRP